MPKKLQPVKFINIKHFYGINRVLMEAKPSNNSTELPHIFNNHSSIKTFFIKVPNDRKDITTSIIHTISTEYPEIEIKKIKIIYVNRSQQS